MNLIDFIYSLIFEEKIIDSDLDVITEIKEFEMSKERQDMLDGCRYFLGDHDILKKQREVVGRAGELVTLDRLPNAQIVNNIYRKLVTQKTNYMVGKPVIISAENDTYQEELKKIFNKNFQRKLHYLMEDCLNEGIAWLYPYVDGFGKLKFREFHGYEILPVWKDESEEELLGAVRFHDHKIDSKYVRKVEIFTQKGLYSYRIEGNRLVEEKPMQPYMLNNGVALEWGGIPLIPFRYNRYNQPLICRVKSLQDGINQITSIFEDRIEEDPRQTVLVLHNYDGQDLGEFREKLSVYGAVKVADTDAGKGDVTTLEIEVNCENYKAILKEFTKAIIDNGAGYDAKDDKAGQNANEMNIKSIYNNIDLDTNGVEIQFQCSMEQLMCFVDEYLKLKDKGNFTEEMVSFVFNRDMIMNDSEKINMVTMSTDLSLETRLEHHPWVDNVERELERIKGESQEYSYGLGVDENDRDGETGEEPTEEDSQID